MKIKLPRLIGLVLAGMLLASCATTAYSSQSSSVQQPTSAHVSTQAPAAQQPPVASSNVVDIKIAGFAFTPNTLTIKVGTEVRWTNYDTVNHNVTSDTGNVLSSPSISQGQSWSHVFEQAGTFAYHCGIHPSMVATITVTP
jgi:plastocyanin